MDDNNGKNSFFDVSAKPSEGNIPLLMAQGSSSALAEPVAEKLNEEIYDKSEKSDRPSKGFIEINKSVDGVEKLPDVKAIVEHEI